MSDLVVIAEEEVEYIDQQLQKENILIDQDIIEKIIDLEIDYLKLLGIAQ